MFPRPLAAALVACAPFAVGARSAPDTIIVTAARVPVRLDLAGVSASVLDATALTALQLPQASDYLRLTPGVAIATSGGIGQQTQVRIRGAEANHTLVFVDGIPTNDPASSGEFLFQTLPTDGLARIEVLRGPQSALWGSEAIGGVIAVTTAAPDAGRRLAARGEGGSLGTWRVSAAGGAGSAAAGVSATAAYVATDGIDISGTPAGDRDGFDNLVLSAKGVLRPGADGELGIVARYTNATTRFDDFGFDGRPADAPLASTNRALAVRGYAKARPAKPLALSIDAAYVDTANSNRRAGAYENRADATRLRIVAQASLTATTGALGHRLTAAVERDAQTYRAADAVFGGLTDQRARRDRTSAIGEYRIDHADKAAASISVRHDANSAFADATTLRAAAAVRLGGGLGVHASYGEGVTDPTFTEQFGFFPGFFVGNPALRPERARGYDAGVSWRGAAASIDLIWFETDLTAEIVSTFDGATFLAGVANADGRSRRRGIEVAADVRPATWLRLEASYTWLDASERPGAGGALVREVRRPRHSGSLSAIAERGPAQAALTLAYVGDRTDQDFATFPATPATLGDYVLASLSGRYRLMRGVTLTARVENAFDARYEDALGYRTPGLTAYGGVALALD